MYACTTPIKIALRFTVGDYSTKGIPSNHVHRIACSLPIAENLKSKCLKYYPSQYRVIFTRLHSSTSILILMIIFSTNFIKNYRNLC